MKKISPIEKIYEAYSAVVDNRVELKEKEAYVKSSDYSKKYTVIFTDDTYSSNDSASYWQGYAGYPIIAVLMLQNKLSLNMEIANYFKNINWKKLNKEYKNKYSEAVESILKELKEKGINIDLINNEINKVYKEIEKLEIDIKRNSLKPLK